MAEDNWRHRTPMMTCDTCMYFVVKTGDLGRCRRHAPHSSGGGWPAMFKFDWCGDHKLDADRLAERNKAAQADVAATVQRAARDLPRTSVDRGRGGDIVTTRGRKR